jgi:hypothetical protein
MDMLKMAIVVVALLALAGCIVEPFGGGGPGYYGGDHRDGGDRGGGDRWH